MNAALHATAEALRAAGYQDRAVCRALGELAWSGPSLDTHYWARRNLAEGRLGSLVDLFIRGLRVPLHTAEALLPPAAWAADLVEDDGEEAWAIGTLLPLGADYIWTDRADRTGEADGLFLPDSTTWAVRMCLPPETVERHLDLGAGAGAVTVRAARRARFTMGIDPNPRSVEGTQTTAALSGVSGIESRVGTSDALVGQCAPFDRISFTLPLMVRAERHLAGTPIHTISATSDLLARVIGQLPALLSPGGLALIYAQEWGDGAPLPELLAASFGDRPWRTHYWWDHAGDPETGEPSAGIFAIRADQTGGWSRSERGPEPLGAETWWPQLADLLGRGP